MKSRPIMSGCKLDSHRPYVFFLYIFLVFLSELIFKFFINVFFCVSNVLCVCAFVILRTVTERLAGETRPYSGHFEILRSDGSVIPVNSEGQNCLYHAVVQATSQSPADLKQRAEKLRNEVKTS
ncbi:hypothetical protein AMECASPLE_039856, partial [Ameca splendens]